jgi:hypothetical protein
LQPMPLHLRLKVQLSLENPNLNRCFQAHGQSPRLISIKSTPEARVLHSAGITRHHREYDPLQLPPGPTHNHIVAGHDPASGTGLPRYPRYLPDMLSPLPRWIGYVPIPLRPSPNIGRVGIHNCPFRTCSGFTRVTAYQVAAAL